MRRLVVFVLLVVGLPLATPAQELRLPKKEESVKFAVIGGSSSKLRKGDLRKSELTFYGNDSEYAFMLVEIVGDEMYFQAVNDKGTTIDVGSVRRVGKVEPTRDATAQPVVPQAKPSPSQPGPRGRK